MPDALTREGTCRRRLGTLSGLKVGRGRERTGVVLGRGHTTGGGPLNLFVLGARGREGRCRLIVLSCELNEETVEGRRLESLARRRVLRVYKSDVVSSMVTHMLTASL